MPHLVNLHNPDCCRLPILLPPTLHPTLPQAATRQHIPPFINQTPQSTPTQPSKQTPLLIDHPTLCTDRYTTFHYNITHLTSIHYPAALLALSLPRITQVVEKSRLKDVEIHLNNIT